MHKSKLSGFIIDCETLDLDRSADFWGNALGMPVRALPPGEGEIYKRLEDNQHGLNIEVQAVSHPSRVHLDIDRGIASARSRACGALTACGRGRAGARRASRSRRRGRARRSRGWRSGW